MTDVVLVQQRDQLVEVLLNRPRKRNAMNLPMMQALEAAFDEIERMEGARVVLIRSEGRGFSTGIDLMSFNEIAEHFGSNWQNNLFPLTAAYQRVMDKVEACTLPVICLMHGYALGMAFELALACDFRIVAEHTRIGLPESRLGLIPDVGGTTRLLRLVGPARAKEIIMTGRDINLEQAERWGIVNYVVSKADLLAKAEELAGELIAAAPLAVSYAKRVINDIMANENAFRVEAWAQAQLIRTEDFATGAQSMLMRQTPEWKGK